MVVLGEVEVASFSLSSSAAAAVVGEDVGTVVAAVAAAAVGEDEGGAEKNAVMLFCFCFLPVDAGIAPGSLRLRGPDILDVWGRCLLLSLRDVCLSSANDYGCWIRFGVKGK